MSLPSLLIFEGPDGVGKTTQVEQIKYLLSHSDTSRETIVCSQPSPDNIVGFIRKEAKTQKALGSFERQLLIACSHIVDAFTAFPENTNVVMDRSWLSGLVYGKLTELTTEQYNLLTKVLRTVYYHNINGRFNVKVFMVNADKRLDQPDDDVFERSIEWDKLRDTYRELAAELKNSLDPAFSQQEQIIPLEIEGLNAEQVHGVIKVHLGL